MNEFVIEWNKTKDYAGITVPSGTAWKTKLIQYSELYPDKVKIISINNDGSAFFHVPIKWIKCSPPRKISEEQKEAAAERFREMWKQKVQ